MSIEDELTFHSLNTPEGDALYNEMYGYYRCGICNRRTSRHPSALSRDGVKICRKC